MIYFDDKLVFNVLFSMFNMLFHKCSVEKGVTNSREHHSSSHNQMPPPVLESKIWCDFWVKGVKRTESRVSTLLNNPALQWTD